jgi:hypothetical protein
MSMPQKPICFVIMPFADPFKPVMEKSIRPAIEAADLRCLRGDEIPDTGMVVDQIRKSINDSVTCVADLTGLNRNVVYEVALAHEKGKPVILITQDDPGTLPFDLRHFRAIKYTQTMDGLQELREKLSRHLSAVVADPESPTRYLEEMLVPRSVGTREGPFIVAANPLVCREAAQTAAGYKRLRHTCSDHVGVRGLVQAFGLIFGLERLPDLLNPEDYADKAVQNTTANIYCIGSPLANRWSGLFLGDFYKRWSPRLEFKADPASPDLRNIWLMLEKDGKPYEPASFTASDTPFARDFGLVIRGPHPADSSSVLMVLAGRASLGTEAASNAATNPTYIAEIKTRLSHEHVDLSDHKQAFWALVTMSRNMTEGGTYEAIVSSFEIAEVHRFLSV